MNSKNNRTIAIIGMGLIGGSLGLALRRFAKDRARRWRVIGLGRGEKSLHLAKRRGACHEISVNWRASLSKADDVVICTPPADIVPVIKRIRPWVKPGAVISDVGSVKEVVLRGWRELKSQRGRVSRPSFSFVGAHPMAGSETSGVGHARADLFQGAVCVITPCPGERREALKQVEEMWKACGAAPVFLKASVHDRIVALTSHLPHLVASGLVLSLVQECRSEPLARRLVARSFLDLTRVAASNPAMWSKIFQANQTHLMKALKNLETMLLRLCKGRLSERLLRVSAAARQRWSS